MFAFGKPSSQKRSTPGEGHSLTFQDTIIVGDDPGVAVAALAETLGHKDVRTTMRYTQASKAGKLRVVQAQEGREIEEGSHNSVTDEKRQAS